MIEAGTKKKSHFHKGALEPYDGKPLSISITNSQLKLLEKGEPVIRNERTGKVGKGMIVQDVNATPSVVMNMIRDFPSYHKMVPHVKKVEIYENLRFLNGSTKTGAEFTVGLLGMRFGYFLMFKHEPKYNTLTWTLDYRYNSDFDDNVGHWQVVAHPTKQGWTRVYYSCRVKLFSWIPEFIADFLAGNALIDSSGWWVKRESELEQKRLDKMKPPRQERFLHVNLPNWFSLKGGYIDAKEMIDSMHIALQKKMKAFENDIAYNQKRFYSSFNPMLTSYYK